MNAELRADLIELSDLFSVFMAVKNKLGVVATLPLILKAGEDISGIVANLSDFQPELKALLSNPAADADLVSAIAALPMVAGSSAKAQAVVSAVCRLVIDGVSDVEAVIAAFSLPA